MNKIKITLGLYFCCISTKNIFAFNRGKHCLVENINTDITTLNPHDLQDLSKMRVIDDLFEGLVSYNQNGEVIPACASSWDILEEGKKIIFHLREDAHWSNGENLTAHDFVFSFRHALRPNNPTKNFVPYFDIIENAKEIRQGIKNIDALSVKASDDFTLEIKLEHASETFLNFLCLGIFYPVHQPSVAKYGMYYCSTPEKTVNNGAYCLKKFVHNGHIILKKNPYYWDEKNVNIDEVKFLMLQDAATDMQAFNSKSLDITYGSLPTRGEEFYKKKYGNRLHQYFVIRQDILILNFDKEKFSEVSVRKALTMAINKKLYIEKVIKFGKLSFNPIVEIFGKKFKDVYLELPEYEWTKEKFDKNAIEAEWLIDDFFTKEKPLNVKIIYPISTFYENVAEFIQNSWRKVFKGAVNVEIEAKTPKNLLECLQCGDFDICLYQKNGYINSPIDFISSYLTDSPNNFFRYNNPNFDKMFYDFLSKGNDDLLQYEIELSKMLLRDFVSIPLFSLPVMKLINENVFGFCEGNNILNRYKTKDLMIL